MTQSNLLKSIFNISKLIDLDLENSNYSSSSTTRINAVGENLESFIKDSFCGIPGKIENRENAYKEVFSWEGSKNNPPDAMLRDSDAIEIKKHQGTSASDIALNSSPPRTKLKHDDSKISDGCKKSEKTPWTKNYLYLVGNVVDNKIQEIIFCYGDCFVAEDSIYQKPVDAVRKVLDKLKKKGLETADTNELGKISKVDPLGLSGLRIRGMWSIKSPKKFFENEIKSNTNGKLLIVAIMTKEKFDKFPDEDRLRLDDNFDTKHFKSPDPNDSKKMINLVIIQSSSN